MKTTTTLALVAVATLAGCTPTTFEVPKTPNPVLLGNVERIGGAKADPNEKLVTNLTGGGALRAGSARPGFGGDKGGEFKKDGASERVTAAAFVQQVLTATDAREERTVHVKKVRPVSYMMIFFVGAYLFVSGAQDVEISASVTERAPSSPVPPAPSPLSAQVDSATKEVAHVAR